MFDTEEPAEGIRFQPIASEVLTYHEDHLQLAGEPLSCLKRIDNRFEIYADPIFSDSDPFEDEMNDYYIVDKKEPLTILFPSANQYEGIVTALEAMLVDERPHSAFVNQTKSLVLTTARLVGSGWTIEETPTGDVLVIYPDGNKTKRFVDDDALRKWILEQDQSH